MHKEIAVFVDNNGNTASLYEPGRIKVYRKQRGMWSSIKEFDFVLDKSLGIKELRKQMDNVVSQLADCRIFVGLTLTGMPYFALEKGEFSIWEFEGRPLEFLDYILDQEEKAEEERLNKQDSNIIPFPIEVSDGYYQLNLKEIQANSGITSKQALMPFIRQGKFYSLEILCSHIPPWLENELMGGKLKCDTLRMNSNELKVIITKKCCNEC